MDLNNLSIQKFVETTASGEPVPGGGSISALSAALAAALATMVARLTLGKKKYADVQPRIQELIDQLAPLPAKLLESVDLDSEAYDQVFQAYRLPKETEQERQLRDECIQSALIIAATVPLSVASSAAALLPVIEEIVTIGNVNAVTDAYVAAQCARTAVLGAAANVRINLISITDQSYVADTLADIAKLEERAIAAEQAIRQAVLPKIS